MWIGISNTLSNLCFLAGFLSIGVSIAVWFFYRDSDVAHAERLGIFIGLWAPTFFILSGRFHRSNRSLLNQIAS
jgi:hypothetical protein